MSIRTGSFGGSDWGAESATSADMNDTFGYVAGSFATNDAVSGTYLSQADASGTYATKTYADETSAIRTKQTISDFDIANLGSAAFTTIGSVIVSGLSATDTALINYFWQLDVDDPEDRISSFLYHSGVQMSDSNMQIDVGRGSGTDTGDFLASKTIYHVPGAGNHIYSIQAKSHNGTETMNNIKLTVIVFK